MPFFCMKNHIREIIEFNGVIKCKVQRFISKWK